MPDLLGAARSGDSRALGRLISAIEDGGAELSALANAKGSNTAQVIGITGAPGVGKSTLTAALVSQLRKSNQRVAVLAVDPSSPFTGGALLGDRIRMQEHSLDSGVFIRSMATRGRLGGLSWAVPAAVRLLELCEFDVVLIETVGVGQSEVEVVRAADTAVVVTAPGLGDSVQAAKAGLLEIGDIYVVNKADRDGADQAVHELSVMLDLAPASNWRPPVLKVTANTGAGVADLAQWLAKHREESRQTGEWQLRRKRRAAAEIAALVTEAVQRRLSSQAHQVDLLAESVSAGDIGPAQAAEQLIADLLVD